MSALETGCGFRALKDPQQLLCKQHSNTPGIPIPMGIVLLALSLRVSQQRKEHFSIVPKSLVNDRRKRPQAGFLGGYHHA